MILNSQILIRIFDPPVMPAKVDEGCEIMKWLAENVSKDLMMHVMEQYFPRAHVGKTRRASKQRNADQEVSATGELRYADINRPVNLDEVSSVKEAAKEAGLWRFVEVAQHGGFNL